MNLPNKHFEGFPIDFKAINPPDFIGFEATKKIITPNSDGFISESLITSVDLDEKNTVVVNAAVGQGKTTAIMEIVKRYYHDTDYVIFIASPYISLIEQYYNKAISIGIPDEEIYRYEWIGTDFSRDAGNSRIQIVTANCLLGNPGDDSPINAEAKRNYLEYLSKKCEDHGKKAIFIFDEIHDCIHNFKPELVIKLFKWRNVIGKIFTLSATYNEASKTVIEYFAELTNNKIQIIEAERVLNPSKQSDLFLHFDHSRSYTNTTDTLVNLVDSLVKNGKKIDILSFSKKLANSICDNKFEGAGKLLFNAFGEVNKCTSGLSKNSADESQDDRFKNENRFDNSKCNVGTNFKSGVSIEKDNHAFIVILPPHSARLPFKNEFGIFNNGINTVIQALARQRRKGEIHVILPMPDKFDYESLPFEKEEQKEAFIQYYELVHNSRTKEGKEVKFISQNQQHFLLKEFYDNVILEDVLEQKQFIESSGRNPDLASLTFPGFKDYRLSKGENYFPKYHKFCGTDLSAFILFSAITNQFINCKLMGTNVKPPLLLVEGKLQWKLQKTLMQYLDLDLFNYLKSFASDKYIYNLLQKEVMENFKILFKNKDGVFVEPTQSELKLFNQQIIAFTQRYLYPENRVFSSRFNNDGYIVDSDYSRGEYFRTNISQAIKMEKEGFVNDLTSAYLKLDYYRNKVIDAKQSTGRDIVYLPNEAPIDFITASEFPEFEQMINNLTSLDSAISEEIFDFKNVFSRADYDPNQKIQAFYNYIRQDFFDGANKRVNNSELNSNVFKIKSIYDLPDPNSAINLLKKEDYKVQDDFFPEVDMTTLQQTD